MSNSFDHLLLLLLLWKVAKMLWLFSVKIYGKQLSILVIFREVSWKITLTISDRFRSAVLNKEAGLFKIIRDAGTDARTALVAVDASSAVPSSVPASIEGNGNL